MDITEQLHKNKYVFQALLEDIDQEFVSWRPKPDKWCMLEIVCHLYDEERLDFRFRTQWVLEKPGVTPPPFNPLDWVKEHNYKGQDYDTMVAKFLMERQASIRWLQDLVDPDWSSSYKHATQGNLTAKHYLDNWLAHDYLHMRQIIKYKFNYLEHTSRDNLDYAGIW